MKQLLALWLLLLVLTSCTKNKDNTAPPNLVFKFKFDSTQVRLNNLGQPGTIAAGNAAQSPLFNVMSAHYIELAPGALTQLGQGAVLYKANETTAGGASAIDFAQAKMAANNEVFFTIPIKNVTPGDYEWLRLSLAFQNYDIKYRVDTTISGIAINQDVTGTIASFIGYNSYIGTYKVKNENVIVNGNRKQGYWGFETMLTVSGMSKTQTVSGQAPDGATTVVNPLFATSPIPQGSCVVTAAFAPGKLKIRGTETKDIIVEISLSTNKSFEWKELITNGKWDPLKNEPIVDIGIRGMIPSIK